MDNEKEVIEQEMNETRSALSDKIELLEKQVVETVQDASAGVKETVGAVKEAVQETVQSVKDSVEGTVHTVQDAFSLQVQMERRPWVVLGGAAAAGFAAGYLFAAPRSESVATPSPRPRPERTGNGAHKAERFASPVREQAAEGAGIFGHVSKAIESEIDNLKGLAVGTLTALVRDLATLAVPDLLRHPIEEAFDEIAVKLGGRPIRGRILPEPQPAVKSGDERPDDSGIAKERERSSTMYRNRLNNPM